MVGIKLFGGIGEQLFQYALARSLSIRNKTELFYDLSLLDSNPNWLEKFNTPKQPNLDVVQVKLLAEPDDNFHPEFLSMEDGILFYGKFQFEKYFEEQSDQIRKELVIKDQLSEDCLEIDSQIRSDMHSGQIPVSIHIPKSSMDSLKKYYAHCVNFLSSNFSNLTLYIFSDDVPRCMQEFQFNAPAVFIDMQGSDHEEIYLASLCRHHIISDEIKSFWHAWLDRRISSFTFAPRKYLEHFSESGRIDRLPDRWMVFESREDSRS